MSSVISHTLAPSWHCRTGASLLHGLCWPRSCKPCVRDVRIKFWRYGSVELTGSTGARFGSDERAGGAVQQRDEADKVRDRQAAAALAAYLSVGPTLR